MYRNRSGRLKSRPGRRSRRPLLVKSSGRRGGERVRVRPVERHRLTEIFAGERPQRPLRVAVTSFGFKHGVPTDADFVFDVRCLPNPHWIPTLRGHTGLEQPVIEFLDQQAPVVSMRQDISDFLARWIPQFEAENRSYLTVAIGCTGGQHRSVYLAEALSQDFGQTRDKVTVRHRDIA